MPQLPPHHSPPHPPALNYQQPYYGPPPPHGRPLLHFFGGLGLGTLLSIAAWPISFSSRNPTLFVALLFLVPVAKIASGVTFLCLRPYRLLGGGILASLGLGFLIFFGACAHNFRI